MTGRRTRRALLLLGVDGAGAATLARLLGAMGCDLATDQAPETGTHPAGRLEAGRFSALNDEIFASVGMSWLDQRPFPADWYASPEAGAFADRAQRALAESFGGSELFAIHDPRISRLLPFWFTALTKFGAEPLVVDVHGDPAAVAAALAESRGMEPLNGEMLWLRSMLEAERDSRGRPRVFVAHDQLTGDGPSTIDRIARQFGIIFSGAIADATGLISVEPQAHSKASLEIVRRQTHSGFVATAFAIFGKWARMGEDVSDHAALDDARTALETASETLEPILGALATLHGENRHVPALVPGNQRDARRLDLVSERLEATEASLAETRQTLASISAAADAQKHRERELTEQFNERSHELIRARKRPLRNLRYYLEFKALKALSSDALPLPAKTKSRFRRSAAKRDPKRFMPERVEVIEVRPDPVEVITSLPGSVPYNADRPVVVVVSHEASRSGAPILALNLAKTYAERYNVVAVCLRGGELLGDFLETCTEVHIARPPINEADQYDLMVDAIGATKRPLFAIVNSIESRYILRAFREHGIPTVGLFHEFASYILPRTAFSEAFREADQIVFSTELTIENALEQTSSVRTERFHVLPQGRCELPGRTASEASRQLERDRLEAVMLPNGRDAGEFLVLGAGYVQMRKGVDLFIDVARRVLSTDEGRSARFVWIGPNYNPELDAAYSVYLKDQISRAGLSDRMIIAPETSEIDHAYALSSVLLLTSRLDPLPNVAIDAMSEGLPIVCFDKTTGIADLLTEAGLGPDCVADYLDTEQAAAKLFALMRSPEHYRHVADATRNYAAIRFDARAYAERIEDMALMARAAAEALESDLATIAAAERFDPAFMLPERQDRPSANDAARYYLTENKRRPEPRRPEPGFNPLLFGEAMAAKDEPEHDAYAAFLRQGRPQGDWIRQVIRETDAMPEEGVSPGIRTALHIHAYYTDIVPAIAERLAVNASRPDLFVSAADETSLDDAVARLQAYGGRIAEARVVANRGRDLGPLLTAFGSSLVRNYDLIGHVHTKKTASNTNRGMIERWVEFLYENTLGGEQGGPMMDRIIAAFARDSRLGIVFPSDPNILAWSANESIGRSLAERLHLASLPRHFDFPIGSMFWARAEAIEPFISLGLDWRDYPIEPAGHDGTVLHAIERLFGIIAESRGLNIAVTHVNDVTR
ncbi:glycosyltransferase [Mesorhizobium sp. BR1-1-16]|uniref:rhamnan synthesis F family protein n=1 Tax=Mesorhizobium sp. BR1-1-16 TaxID=2876653 RepID=UPI001CCA6FA0|nr:rhamnan synthesis F family protein [Mesorhizobium sp. BR1-1-16]MBZ9937691.1 glycosyltransferase [Mesorhizobium sp. BR1-1-16]